jgi:hypothetical protein
MISDELKAFHCDESAFLFAAQDILQTIAGFSSVRLPGDTSPLPDEVCAVAFTRVATSSDAPRGLTPANKQEYSVFTGELVVTYGLPRASNVLSDIVGCYRVIDEARGAIRACFARSAENFTDGRLPNFVVNDIMPAAAAQIVDDTNDRERDTIVERFTIVYERRMNNWPA